MVELGDTIMKNISHFGRLITILALSVSVAAHGDLPIILAFIPASGTNGTPITIIWTNFNSTAASNFVYFGAVRATVSSVSATAVKVTVPVGQLTHRSASLRAD